MKTSKNSPNIAINKKAHFHYILHDSFVAGIVLKGWEVKSIRARKVQISDSYVTIQNNAVRIINMNIMPLVTASTHTEHISTATRNLLLTKKEIHKLDGILSIKGMSAIPTSIFWSRNYLKIKFYTATGKKLYDKREVIKKRDIARRSHDKD